MDPVGSGERRIGHIAGVPNAGGLEQHQLDLVLGHGAVLHTVGDHEAVARAEFHDTVAELDPESAPMDDETWRKVTNTPWARAYNNW